MTNVYVYEYSLKCKNDYFYMKVQIYMDVNAFKNLRCPSVLDGIQLTEEKPELP